MTEKEKELCPLCGYELERFMYDEEITFQCNNAKCSLPFITFEEGYIAVMRKQIAEIRKQERVRILGAFSDVFQKAKMTEEQAEYFLKEYRRIEKEQLGD